MPKPGRKRKPGPREPNGRTQRNTRAEQEAAMATVLTARARHAGVTLTPEAVADLRQPWHSSDYGRAMAAEPDTVTLWCYHNRFMTLRRAYLAAVDAPPPWPKAARLGDAPPPGEAEPSRHDPRTPEERADAALRNWDALVSAVLAIAPVGMSHLLQAAEHDDPIAIKRAVAILRQLGERMGW
jgi:hypothetical protein